MDKSLFSYIWRHSWRDQIVIFTVVIASLPFYFMSLDLPKRIVNDAIQGRAFKDGHSSVIAFDWTLYLPDWLGGGSWRVSDGIALDQMGLLMALSAIFLGFVLINGAFKYWINVAKGALGERMLRRLRFDLVAMLFRFTPGNLRAVKPSEMATIVKDEVEPIGGFIGDAFALPLFLGAQAATAMLFILLQNVWLGLLAGAVVGVQLVIIPKLRREQLRLGKERQLASRKLAGRVGEIVEGMEAIRVHDGRRWEHAEIGWRLHSLFDLRFRLFKRKFMVKYLNNLLTQVTPFLFYSIGGYFALTGRLDIGQLVAVIGAYRELPPPLKELIDWDQQRLDVQVKYDQVVQQFAPEDLLPDHPVASGSPFPTETLAVKRLVAEDLRLVDHQGAALVEGLSFDAALPATLGAFGDSGGPGALARAFARLERPVAGQVAIDGHDLHAVPEAWLRRDVAYAGPDPFLFPGSLRENLLYGVRRPPFSEEGGDAEERRRRLEALRTGNPLDDPRRDWVDYDRLGVMDADALDRFLLEALDVAGLRADVYRFGLAGRVGMALDADMEARIVAARRALRERLSGQGMHRLVEPFDPQAYNPQATIVENITFGVPRDGGSPRRLAEHPLFRRALEESGLLPDLQRLGERIAETMTEIFRGLPPGHALFEQFSFIAADDLEEYEDILRRRAPKAGKKGRGGLTSADRERLVHLTLDYSEPRHRLGLIDGEVADRILLARRRFHALAGEAAGPVDFYDPDRVCAAAPLRDNLLFGRIAFGQADAEARVAAELTRVVDELGLREAVERVGLGHGVGPGGRLLTPAQRARVALARALIGRPSLLLLDQALASLPEAEAARVLARVAQWQDGRSLFFAGRVAPAGISFDVSLVFDGARARLAAADGPAAQTGTAGREPDAQPARETAR